MWMQILCPNHLAMKQNILGAYILCDHDVSDHLPQI
jgi:hypothetical protein